jgi:hypothetical protein
MLTLQLIGAKAERDKFKALLKQTSELLKSLASQACNDL